MVFVGFPGQTHAKFVIASWDYPDEYGQGIETIYYQVRWENDTVKEWGYTYPNGTQTFEVPPNGTVYLRFTAWVNGTQHGISAQAEAQNFIRYDIDITNVRTHVLTTQNFTYDGVSGDDAPMYKVYHLIYLSGWHGSATEKMTNGFVAGQIYAAAVNCEISETTADYNLDKTMVFDGADPYSTYTYTDGTGSQGIVGGAYVLETPVNGDTEMFGYDEFTSYPNLHCEVTFTPTDLTGTYRFMPIVYVYQKTDLEASVNWALSIFWYSVGLRLYHNTGQGSTPTDAPLVGTGPIVNHEYDIILASYGNETWVSVYDVTADGSVYSGNITTNTYDPTVLYASFGQYSAANGAIDGEWDNFAIMDYVSEWGVVTTATLIFTVSWDPVAQFGYDAFFIFMGLIMIPFSTIYLVKGGRKELSQDKVFYFLIMFMMGWAFFIGGIMP